jgi:hypothetical protein
MRKKLQMVLQAPLVSTMTGRYNCSARYANDRVEVVSWYVYFYPGKFEDNNNRRTNTYRR